MIRTLLLFVCYLHHFPFLGSSFRFPFLDSAPFLSQWYWSSSYLSNTFLPPPALRYYKLLSFSFISKLYSEFLSPLPCSFLSFTSPLFLISLFPPSSPLYLNPLAPFYFALPLSSLYLHSPTFFYPKPPTLYLFPSFPFSSLFPFCCPPFIRYPHPDTFFFPFSYSFHRVSHFTSLPFAPGFPHPLFTYFPRIYLFFNFLFSLTLL